MDNKSSIKTIIDLCKKEPGFGFRAPRQGPKVGDPVVISVSSNYYPKQMEKGNWKIGTLYTVDGGMLPYGVRWSNGYQNSYSKEDLVFLEQVPQSNSEGRFLLRSN